MTPSLEQKKAVVEWSVGGAYLLQPGGTPNKAARWEISSRSWLINQQLQEVFEGGRLLDRSPYYVTHYAAMEKETAVISNSKLAQATSRQQYSVWTYSKMSPFGCVSC